MGKPKQLLEFQGETLISKIVKTALETPCRPLIIILGAYYNEMSLEIKKLGNLEIVVVNNKDWEQGMSTSVKMGL